MLTEIVTCDQGDDTFFLDEIIDQFYSFCQGLNLEYVGNVIIM